MKYKYFIFLLSIISSFFISTSLSALPTPEVCPNQEEYADKEFQELYCIKCDSTYPKPSFFDSYNKIKIETFRL